MNVEIRKPSSSAASGAGSAKEATPPARHWRLSLPVSLGVLLLLASLVIVVWSLRSHAGSARSTNAVTPAEGTRWSSLGYVDIEGGVTPLYPALPGRVTSIEAKENELVKAGAPLFHLDDTVPVDRVRQAEAALRGEEAKLAIAEAKLEQANKHIEAQKTAIAAAQKNVDKARLDLDKQRDFEKRKIGGDKETVQAAEITLDQAKLAAQGEEQKLAIAQAAKREAEAYVTAMRASVEAKKAQLDEAKHAVNECVVRAPVDGMPLRILVTKGQVLGSNPRQSAVEFAADLPLLVRAEVEQEFVSHVRPDQKVIIEDNVTGKEIARGKVVSIARWYAPRRTTVSPEMPGLNNDVRTLECIIHLESKSPEVRIHQRMRVQFPD